MPKIHGRDAAVYLADNGATVRNLSSFCDSVDVTWEVDLADATTFGSGQSREYIPGFKDHTISLSGKWDSLATATPDQWLTGLAGHATAVQFTLFPAGSAAGAVYHRGSAFLTNYAYSVPFDEIVSWTAELQVSGAITRATA